MVVPKTVAQEQTQHARSLANGRTKKIAMGTISAVNAIIEGMTPVTNMDDSIHGTF